MKLNEKELEFIRMLIEEEEDLDLRIKIKENYLNLANNTALEFKSDYDYDTFIDEITPSPSACNESFLEQLKTKVIQATIKPQTHGYIIY